MSSNIFTYGSLMFPEVWEKVVRGKYRSTQAVAPDHARFAIRGETYPGMVTAPGQTVAGVVYFDVTPDDVAALDIFEGTPYRRDVLQVRLAGGETLAADTYIYLDTAQLADAPWEPDAFQMQRFLDTYCRDKLA
ncbi:gamma-glutamylcyclotransferase [Noviherbaspirillum cavernae]|uniref:Putative gamma-glutamylcyclotransferase n=1 Tax=Noviherbaspirillum cavernae TaxID=2320862 RepID=A0A418X4W6_9BURK|nr:gamma-glutamylcyclotransferase family protein [Noviherbaspirillum cavernae]RJG07527.1 gamma-glutamylcyclotransferase [Noviherbaspirillum cavernae]